MWKAIEIKAGEIRLGKTEGKRKERGRGKETREERTKREGKGKIKKRKNNGSKEDSRRMGNLRWKRRGSKIEGRGKMAGTREVPQVDPCLWQKKPVKGSL